MTAITTGPCVAVAKGGVGESGASSQLSLDPPKLHFFYRLSPIACCFSKNPRMQFKCV